MPWTLRPNTETSWTVNALFKQGPLVEDVQRRLERKRSNFVATVLHFARVPVSNVYELNLVIGGHCRGSHTVEERRDLDLFHRFH